MFGKIVKLHLKVEWSAINNNPPDRVTQFHAYVGNVESGFQTMSQLIEDTVDIEAGAYTRIMIKDLFKSLDDPLFPIDMVATTQKLATTVKAKKGKQKSAKAAASAAWQKTATPRNLFSGGKGFTTLEAYCFNLITRRYMRPSIPGLIKNKDIAVAATNYLKSKFNPSDPEFPPRYEKIKEMYQQMFLEYAFRNDSELVKKTEDDKGNITYSTSDAAIKKSVDERVEQLLAEYYVGSRFTVRNLPGYRTYYFAIRKILEEAHNRKKPMTWFDAAAKASNSDKYSALAPKRIYKGFELSEIKAGTYERMAREMPAALKDTDCYIGSGSPSGSTQWILPISTGVDGVFMCDRNGDVIEAGGEKIKAFAGLLNTADAYVFGIPVFCTQKASEAFNTVVKGRDFLDITLQADADTQVAEICEIAKLKWYKLNNGGYWLYERSENATSIMTDEFLQNIARAPVRIPAVYDLTIDPLRIIRMPFMGFLDPMSVIEWNSPYVLGSMIGYYYQPETGRNLFRIIKMVVEFSTIERDKNVTELTVTDENLPPIKYNLPDKVEKGAIADLYFDVEITPDSELSSWTELYNSTVFRIPAPYRKYYGENAAAYLTDDNQIKPTMFFSIVSGADSFFGFDGNTVWFSASAATHKTDADYKKRIDNEANNVFTHTDNFPDLLYVASLLSSDVTLKFRYPCAPVNSEAGTLKYGGKLIYLDGSWSMEEA